MKKQKSELNPVGGGLAELKSRLMFVLIGILVYRLGAHIPVPGLDPVKLANYFNDQQNTICFPVAHYLVLQYLQLE